MPPPDQDPPPRAAAPKRRRRAALNTAVQRLVATLGIVGVGAALGAILDSQDVSGWIVGLVVSLESVMLAILLWSSRER